MNISDILRSKRSKLAFFIVFSAGIILGVFLVTISGDSSESVINNFKYVTIISVLVIISLVWIGYSRIRSGITGESIIETLEHDALTYLPFILLTGYFLLPNLPLSEYQKAFSGQSFGLPLFSFCLSGFIALKAYFIKSETKKWPDSNKRGEYGNHPREWQIAIFGLIILAFVLYVCLLGFRTWMLKETSWYTENVLWNLSNGSLNHFGSDLDVQTNMFGTHIYLTLIPVAVLYVLLSSTTMLIIIQSMFVAAGGYIMYKLSSEVTKSHFMGVAASAAYLLHFTIISGTSWGVSADMMSIPLLISSLYYMNKKDFLKMWIFILLFIGSKEIFAVIAFSLGFYLFLFEKEKKHGSMLIMVSLVYFLVAQYVKSYLLMGVEIHSQFTDQLLFLLANPSEILPYFLNPKRVATLFHLLLPTGFLCLLAPKFLLIIFPYLFVVFLDSRISGFEWHYFAPTVPIVIVAALQGVSGTIKKYQNSGLVIALAVFMLCNTIFGLVINEPYKMILDRDKLGYEGYPNRAQADRVAGTISAEYSVMVSPELRGSFVQRSELYSFPLQEVRSEVREKFNVPVYKYPHLRDADYVVVNVNLQSFSEELRKDRLISLINNTDYGISFFEQGMFVFEKGYDHNKGLSNYVLSEERNFEGKKLLDLGESQLFVSMKSDQFVKAGGKISLDFKWKCLQDSIPEYQVLISAVAESKRNYRWIHTPTNGLYPPENWKKGDIIRDSVTLRVPDWMNFGKEAYSIYVSVVRSADSSLLAGEVVVQPDFSK